MTTVRIAAALALSLVSVANVSAVLVAEWKFDGDLSQSVAGGPNIISNSGASFQPGLEGDAVSLSGSASLLELGTNQQQILPGGSDFTVSLFIRSDAAASQNLISFDDDGAVALRTAIYTDATGIRAAFTNSTFVGPGFETAQVGADVAYADAWTHVALTQDNDNGSGQTELSLFINGQPVSTDSVTSSSTGNTIDSGEVGRYHASPNIFDSLISSGALASEGSSYAGLIDNLTIWDEVLSPTAISEISSLATIPEASSFPMLSLVACGIAGRSRRCNPED